MLKHFTLRAVPVYLLVASCIGAAPPYGRNMCEIEKAVIHHMQPGGVRIQPDIHHVAIEDGYAIAAWTAGEAGGIAVLRDDSDVWIILSESGGWDSYEGLISQGVPKKTAEKLAKDFGMSDASIASSKEYQACMGTAETQRAMNACVSNELKRADAELNRVYGEALSSIKNDSIASEKMVKAESAWEAYRNAYIDAMYPAKDKQAHYGSAYTLEVDTLRANLSRKQIEALSCLRLGPSGLLTGAQQCRF